MAEETKSNEQGQIEFSIHKIYVKDSSFEAPSTPAVFQEEWKPEMNINLQSNAVTIDPTTYEVVLTITCTVKNNQKTAFIAEVKQAGIFMIKNFTKEQLEPILGSMCPGIIFPYIRETISNLVLRGGFPQLNIAPINFDALYAESKKKRQEGQQESLQSESDTAH